jgi:hypothetical protein
VKDSRPTDDHSSIYIRRYLWLGLPIGGAISIAFLAASKGDQGQAELILPVFVVASPITYLLWVLPAAATGYAVFRCSMKAVSEVALQFRAACCGAIASLIWSLLFVGRELFSEAFMSYAKALSVLSLAGAISACACTATLRHLRRHQLERD